MFELLISSYDYYYGVPHCSCADPESFVRWGGGGGVQFNSDNLFLDGEEWIKDPIPLKVGHHQPISETPFKTCYDSGLMMAR